jgi:ATP-dependent DNA ligase
MRIPSEPILAAPIRNLVVPAAWVAEPKWDGFRAFLAVRSDGRVMLRSRNGSDMTRAFPEVERSAAEELPVDVLLDGELVVWHDGRLAFEWLVQRINRTGATAARLAGEYPAHFVAFDLLHRGISLQGRPYRERRDGLEDVFATNRLGPTWLLCPAAPVTDTAAVRKWIPWSAAGVEGSATADGGGASVARVDLLRRVGDQGNPDRDPGGAGTGG